MTTRDKLFGFTGRLRRRDWWFLNILLGIAQTCVMFALASVVSVVNLTRSATPTGPFDAMAALPGYITLPLFLGFLWPTVAMSVQRFHDRGASGWPIIAWYGAIYGLNFIPVSAIQWMAAWAPSLDIANAVHTAVTVGIFLIAIWFFVMLGFIDGTPGPNRFGPSPKGLGEDPALDLA